MIYRCPEGCEHDFGWSNPYRPCKPHGARWAYTKGLGTKPAREGKPPTPSLKQGKGFAASKAQRDKVRGLPCVYCGVMESFAVGEGVLVVDPAHLWAAGRGGCASPDCCIPLCREHHRAYDEHRLELLPSLIDRGYWAEMAHPIACHEVSPATLVGRLTIERVAA